MKYIYTHICISIERERTGIKLKRMKDSACPRLAGDGAILRAFNEGFYFQLLILIFKF